MKTQIILILFSMVAVVYSQTYTELSNGTDSKGNIYSVGYDQTTSTNQDCRIAKTYSNGTVAWNQTYDTSSVDCRALNVTFDGSDNPWIIFYVDGGTTSDGVSQLRVEDTAFTDAIFNSPGSSSGSPHLSVVARLDPSTGYIVRGSFFISRLSPTGNANSFAVESIEFCNNYSNVYMYAEAYYAPPAAGSSSSSWTQNVNTSNTYRPNGYFPTYFMTDYNLTSLEQVSVLFPLTCTITTSKLTANDSKSNVYTVGYNESTTTYDDCYVSKKSSNGTIIWNNQYEQTTANCEGTYVYIDQDDNPWVVFSIDSSVNSSDNITSYQVDSNAFKNAIFSGLGTMPSTTTQYSVIAKLDQDTGKIVTGSFFESRLSDGTANTFMIQNITVGKSHVCAYALSGFAPPATGATGSNWTQYANTSDSLTVGGYYPTFMMIDLGLSTLQKVSVASYIDCTSNSLATSVSIISIIGFVLFITL